MLLTGVCKLLYADCWNAPVPVGYAVVVGFHGPDVLVALSSDGVAAPEDTIVKVPAAQVVGRFESPGIFRFDRAGLPVYTPPKESRVA